MRNLWFVATVIFKSEIEGEPSPDEWMCSQDINVIRAPNREIAYEKAINIGKSHEHSYQNMYGDKVVWTFVGLENLEELSNKVIRDGTEVWGRIFHSNNPDDLVVSKEGLNVFFSNEYKNLPAYEILKHDPKFKLVYNRIRI